ncbi:hypothetical protein CEXT_255741 [Caerostris extrusa]|uniref:Uncharacterized protein n=1 Tax=Caerostris extrusa TaxID=172846 RepID=A0AAV4XIY2_CAEEX|nr:hypothetical protein CEXT_255741 [Caerostris extrusa]
MILLCCTFAGSDGAFGVSVSMRIHPSRGKGVESDYESRLPLKPRDHRIYHWGDLFQENPPRLSYTILFKVMCSAGLTKNKWVTHLIHLATQISNTLPSIALFSTGSFICICADYCFSQNLTKVSEMQSLNQLVFRSVVNRDLKNSCMRRQEMLLGKNDHYEP